MGVVVIQVIRHWPFTQQALTKVLEDRFARKVEIHGFHSTYFPPGCVAEQVEFLHRFHKEHPPLITVRALIVKASYAGLFTPHKTVPGVAVVRLRVFLPPTSSPAA